MNSKFPVGLPIKVSKFFLPSSILAKCSAYLNFLDLITNELYIEKTNIKFLTRCNEHESNLLLRKRGQNLQNIS